MKMTSNNYAIDSLKQTLSSAIKRKLQKEIDGLKLRNTERQYSEELTSIEVEVELTTEQLKELKSQISLIRHQISLVEICENSEKIKIKTHITELNNRKKSFKDIFENVRLEVELRKKELTQIEEKEQELLRLKEKEISLKTDQLIKETAAVEKEYETIERECSVLKKRNAAIMLKMRRKLVETENIRKDLLKKKNAE